MGVHYIPNTRIASSLLTNYYLPDKEIAVQAQVTVSFDSDLSKVERITVEVARNVMKTVAGGIPGFEPFIRYHTFGDSGINFSVIMRAREFVDQHLIKHELIKRLHERYRAEGIEIPFPQRTVHLKTEASGPPRNE
jgi:small-conductance mechanosensitive channel